ncbi:hypothetical protein [Halospeciosus flavus]|uniref:Transcriptional regulator n=1 Tax=Halospeciosus flavus TaxID=3032283 RepID=A0ABD5Z706_9EURY|nr:hypothetical protein [Halospeciosus flavus]
MTRDGADETDETNETGETDGDGEPDPTVALEAMDPLEPYTTTEVASLLDVPRRLARRLLDALYVEDEVEKKTPGGEEKPIVWIKPAPRYTCPHCGHEFAVRFVHPVLSRAHYCPRCGKRME